MLDTDRRFLLGPSRFGKMIGATAILGRQRVLADLAACGVTDGHELVSWHTVTLDPAYVHITQRSIAEVDRLKGVLAGRGVHSIGRYGSWTYCSIEDNIVEARALAERLDSLFTAPALLARAAQAAAAFAERDAARRLADLVCGGAGANGERDAPPEEKAA